MAVRAGGAAIIVGGGITGIVAALELLQRGQNVLLLDRDTEANFGGQARESFGGILAVDTPIQRRNGVRDSPSLALADWLRYGELTTAETWPYRWAEAYVNECRAEVFDWLRGMGVRFLPVPQWPERRGNSVPRWHVVWGTGRALTLRLIQALLGMRHAGAGGLELRFGQRVERLLVEAGRIVGVAGMCEDTYEPFEAFGSTVLIASGGIAGDPAMVRHFWPLEMGPVPAELLIGAHRYADGRLHVECRAVGAAMGDLQWMWNYAAGVRHWMPRQPDHGLSLVPPRSALWLDAQGRRFEPPLLAGWDTSQQVARVAAAGGYSWQIMNRRIALRELAVSGAEFNPSIRERRPLAFLRDLLLGNRWLVDTMTALCPDFVVADRLEHLVQRMNALVRAGEDAPALPRGPALHPELIAQGLRAFDAARFLAGRAEDAQWRNIRIARTWKGDRSRTARPQAILDPAGGPLIAIRERIISRKSLGGICTDLEGRVVGTAGIPIAGLYAAGEAAGFGGGGMNGKRALEGTFLGGCIYSARRAARGMALERSAEAQSGPVRGAGR